MGASEDLAGIVTQLVTCEAKIEQLLPTWLKDGSITREELNKLKSALIQGLLRFIELTEPEEPQASVYGWWHDQSERSGVERNGIAERMQFGLVQPISLSLPTPPLPANLPAPRPVQEILDSFAPSDVSLDTLGELLHDFQERELLLDQPGPYASVGNLLTPDERLSIFAYTYHFRAALPRFAKLKGDKLYGTLREISARLPMPLSDAVLQQVEDFRLTASQILDPSDAFWRRVVANNDLVALNHLHTTMLVTHMRSEADLGCTFQVYKASARAMQDPKSAPSNVHEMVHHVLAAVQRLPRVAQQATVFRGARIPTAPCPYEIGTSWVWPTLTSATTEPWVACSAARDAVSYNSWEDSDGRPVIFAISCTEAYRAGPLAASQHHGEVFFPPGTYVQVTGRAPLATNRLLGVGDEMLILELQQIPPKQAQAQLLISEALETWRAGARATALAIFRKVPQLFPSTPSVGHWATALAALYQDEPNAVACEAAIVKALVYEPANPDILTVYACALHFRGELTTSALTYRQALKVNPGFYCALGGYALLLYDQNSQGSTIPCSSVVILVAHRWTTLTKLLQSLPPSPRRVRNLDGRMHVWNGGSQPARSSTVHCARTLMTRRFWRNI
eukprot:NODE_373_length_2582_cov_88.197235_g353_i0.p1 GENE.NODE_373_length_2582_cov_88.197235_g353_i0~~NODE_373_length_2582_cov_88.197235_g353_i0.p1  ORF type:complete len:642 (-),score=85.17 NODE_373_length_2582_cov_88.197235_g353_i0:656-2521(-)